MSTKVSPLGFNIFQFEKWIDDNILESKNKFKIDKYIKIIMPKQHREIYAKMWSKIEHLYREAGWKTNYVISIFDGHYILFEKNNKPYEG